MNSKNILQSSERHLVEHGQVAALPRLRNVRETLLENKVGKLAKLGNLVALRQDLKAAKPG